MERPGISADLVMQPHRNIALPDGRTTSNAPRSEPSHSVRFGDQRIADTGLRHRMTGVGNDDQLRLRPDSVQVPRGEHRTHDVVAALHDDGGDPADAPHVVEELALLPEEP